MTDQINNPPTAPDNQRATTIGRRIADRTLGLLRDPDRVVPAVVIMVLAALTILGISGSSLPLLSEDGRPDDEALLLGEGRWIRSDEFLAWSPIKIGQVQAGFPSERVFGLGEVATDDSWRHQIPSRSIGHVVYSPFNTPLLVLPARQGFAAYWWLPFAGALIALYFWFRRLEARWSVALAAAVLIVTGPAAAWWSGWQLQSLAHAAGGCALIMAATAQWEARPRAAIGLTVLAALVAAGLPWFYQPWAIPAAMFVGLVTLLWGIADPGRRAAFLKVLTVFGALFVLESVLFLLHELDYYRALADTVYPGSRSFDGGGVGLGRVFSSLFAATLNGDGGAGLVGTNLSELSAGWSIALVVATGIAILARHSLREDPRRLEIWGTVATGIVLGSWAVVEWPAFVARVTPLALVPSWRMTPFIGTFGVTALVLLTGDRKRWSRLQNDLGLGGAVILAAAVLGLVLWVATDIRQTYLPSLSGSTVIVVALVATLLATMLVLGRAVHALWLFASMSFLLFAFVNPVTRGLGALEDSSAAAMVARLDGEVADPIDGTWAADDLFLVGLLNGVGVDALSSFNDPVSEEGWRLIDPDGEYEDQWNRFSYIIFSWELGLAEPVIEAVQPDLVVVHSDPCDSLFDDLKLAVVVSSGSIGSAPCLSLESTIAWQGVQRSVFSRDS